eukprot:scaffold833_cov177-Ochromonas_danica.AAC.6
MVSIIPFSGGCYGYVRCTLGPTVGFLTGCSEAAKYILYAVILAYVIGLLFQNVYEFEDHWLPVIWLAFYVCAIAFKAVPLNWSIYVWVGLALMTLITQCIFIFGAAKESNWKHFRKDINPFNTDGDDFLQGLGLAGYLFTGIDSVRTCMDNESNKVVPYVMVILTLVSIMMGLATIISMRAYSMFLVPSFLPFSPGLTIALPGIKAKFADFFTLPCVLGANLGFFYSGGKQISSMMDSRFLPSLTLCGLRNLAKVGGLEGSNKSKRYAVSENKENISDSDIRSEIVLTSPPWTVMETIIPLTISGLVSYILLVVCYYTIDDLLPYIVRTAALLGCFEICCMMGAYLIFSTRFANMDRGFRSPFGMVGALMAIGRRQFFSREEQEKFLKAYIVNANLSKRKARGSFTTGGDGGKDSGRIVSGRIKYFHDMFVFATASPRHLASSIRHVETYDSHQAELRLKRRADAHQSP